MTLKPVKPLGDLLLRSSGYKIFTVAANDVFVIAVLSKCSDALLCLSALPYCFYD